MSNKIEDRTKPDVVDLIIQAETEGFENWEDELAFVKVVVEEGASSALPGHMGHLAREAYNKYKLADRHWKE